MTQDLFNQAYLHQQYWILGIQVLTLFAAAGFAYLQYRINDRLKDLQDYVGLSIVPLENLRLQITNVGRMNLYLHQWEIGENVHNFEEPILIAAEGRTNLLITLRPTSIGQKRATFYLTDEKQKKFLSKGEVTLEPIASAPISQVRLPSQRGDDASVTSNPMISGVAVQVIMSAVSYRTIPFEWNI